MKRALPAIVLVALLAASVLFLTHPNGPAPSASTKPLHAVQTIPLDGVQGRIDHMAVDAHGGRLFVAALGNNTVEVLDTRTGRRVHSITGLSEPQGVAYVPKGNRLYVANGGTGMCDIYDGTTWRKTGSVRLGDDADNVRYDAAHGRILVGYGSGALAILDAADGKVLGTVPLNGHPESYQLDAGGNRAYVNVPDDGEIAVVDLSSRRVAATWPAKGAGANFPMALDDSHHRLFAGCRRPARLLVFDTGTGRETASLSIGGDTDDVWYDATARRVYISCGDGGINVFRQDGADRYTALGEVPTASGARTSLFMPQEKRLIVAVPHRGLQRAEVRVYEVVP